MRKTILTLLSSAAALAGACSNDEATNPFEVKPECQGSAVTAYQGTSPQVISKLSIGSREDGFDFNGDGEPDNKLAAAGSLAKSAIDEALANYEIVIPMEFFDLDAAAADTCVKFAVYLGDYVHDSDGDGEDPLVDGGDCNDKDATIPAAAEIGSNLKDDDCDGLADEDAQNNPSNNMQDMDGDGQSLAQGDCDDTNPAVKRGLPEVCSDGLDNDCDGVADRTGDAVSTACSPFDPANRQDITLDPLSFADGAPAIVFRDGTIEAKGGVMLLHAGPSLFSVKVPVIDGVSLDLRISGATIEGEITDVGGALVIKNGRLGGVIDAVTADTIRGLKVDEIGLTPENSLLDATFANLLGPILALPKATPAIELKYPNCRTPDIDVDRDGLESFCDSDIGAEPKAVDVCIDGDGTEFRDVLDDAGKVVMNCSEAMAGTKRRFVDGISVALTFETSPVKALKPPR
jgi:hypothetical protein